MTVPGEAERAFSDSRYLSIPAGQRREPRVYSSEGFSLGNPTTTFERNSSTESMSKITTFPRRLVILRFLAFKDKTLQFVPKNNTASFDAPAPGN